jgi:hypothetical protein
MPADFSTSKTCGKGMLRISLDANTTVSTKSDQQRAGIRTIKGTTGDNIHCMASDEQSKEN